MRFRRMFPRLPLMILLAASIAACSDDPSGPGSLKVTVSGPAALGSVVVEFTGGGITSATAAPGDWISSSAGVSTFRVLAVAADAGVIQFTLQVADVSAPLPGSVVITGSGPNDRPLLGSGGVEVSISH